jgi:hypothetical protein
MNAPDRSATVRAFYASHPEHFTVDRHDENRRRSLPALVGHLEAVHPEDAGRWGVLVKTDRNNKIPCDVLVWRDTGEHFDVMDSQGGMWNPHGPIHINAGGPDIWFWGPVSVVDPNGEERALQPPPYEALPPSTTPGGGPAPTVDVAPLKERLDALSADVAALRGLVQQLVDRPAPATSTPEVQFPRYEGTLSLGPLGNQSIVLHPKSG